jgi:hypothetical protein
MVGIAVAAFVVGLLIGLASAGGGESDDPADGIDQLRKDLVGAANTLEVAAVEYEESRGAGAGEAGATGASDALARSTEQFDQAREQLARVNTEKAEAISAALDGLEQDLQEEVDAKRFSSDSTRAERLLREAVSSP